jgi:hypothetical protein
MTKKELDHLNHIVRPFLDFRQEVASFQADTFSEVCTLRCFRDSTSACCAREGIAAFFGDVVVNCLVSKQEEIDVLVRALLGSVEGSQCVYLAQNGCLWNLKPIVCEMFLCDHAIETRLEGSPALKEKWTELRKREKRFTWPDRPVLFDDLEEIFINKGCNSPLMYLHKSPGLLRVKSRWKENP